MGNQGFSVIGTMVALTAGMIGVLSVNQLTAQSIRGQRSIASRSDLDHLARRLESLFRENKICGELLNSQVIKDGLSVKVPGSDTVVREGTQYGDWKFRDVTLENKIALNDGGEVFLADFSFIAENDKPTLGSPVVKKTVPIRYREVGGHVVQCGQTGPLVGGGNADDDSDNGCTWMHGETPIGSRPPDLGEGSNSAGWGKWAVSRCPKGHKMAGYTYKTSSNKKENMEVVVLEGEIRARRPNQGSTIWVNAYCCAQN